METPLQKLLRLVTNGMKSAEDSPDIGFSRGMISASKTIIEVIEEDLIKEEKKTIFTIAMDF